MEREELLWQGGSVPSSRCARVKGTVDPVDVESESKRDRAGNRCEREGGH